MSAICLYPPYGPGQTRGSLACYVLGCRAPVALSTQHRAFGLVCSCRSHDPGRHGYGADWTPVGLPPGAPKGRSQGGPRELVPVPPKGQPPAGAYATVGAPVAPAARPLAPPPLDW